MTVRELINMLDKVKDKDKEVVVSSNCGKVEYVNITGGLDYETCLEIIIEELE